LFSQTLDVLLHSVFHFYVFIISSLFDCPCLRVKIPVFNERVCIFCPTVVRGQNGSDFFDSLTHPPLFLPPCVSVKRGD
jgi:hypothetical protein